jgi:hypothetical protein
VVGHFYDRYGLYQPRLIVGLVLTCVVGAALSRLLPRCPEESTITVEDLSPSTQTAGS